MALFQHQPGVLFQINVQSVLVGVQNKKKSTAGQTDLCWRNWAEYEQQEGVVYTLLRLRVTNKSQGSPCVAFFKS